MATRTKAAVTNPTGVSIADIDLKAPGRREAVVRVEAANISIAEAGGPLRDCSEPDEPIDLSLVKEGQTGQGISAMDLAAAFSFPDFTVHGHSGVGVVEEIGAGVNGVQVGDRVMMTSNPNCGVCAYCLRGRPDQCADMVPFGPAVASLQDGSDVHTNGHVGSFAELALMPETQLTPISSDLPSDQLSLIANPVATGVGAAHIIAPVTPGSVVAVVGCGPVGLSYVQGARLADASQIIAVDPVPQRREAALRFGATEVVDPNEADPVQVVRDLSGDAGGLMGRGADFVFEAAGDGLAAEQAWSMSRITGHVVLAGIGGKQLMVSFPYAEFSCIGGRTVHTCQWGGILQRRDFPWLIELTERGQLDVQTMAERSYSFEEFDSAAKDVGSYAVIGATLLPTA